MSAKAYHARRTPDGPWVQVDGEDLKQVQEADKISVSSEEAFDWGYSGSGPARLALAIIVHVTKDIRLAKIIQDDFLQEVISQMPEEGFTLTIEDLRNWAKKKVEQNNIRWRPDPE